jgi:hypothetical protein
MITEEEGNHDFNFEFIFDGARCQVEGTVLNEIETELDERGGEQYKGGETTIELLSVMQGEELNEPLTDNAVLKAIELELYKY